MSDARDFWLRLDELVASSRIVVDRPAGSTHLRYPDLVYPLDYGHLEDTRASDSDPVDVWIGTLPEKALCAVVCTVDGRKRDVETKLLLGCTTEEQQAVLAAHESGMQSAVLVERPSTSP